MENQQCVVYHYCSVDTFKNILKSKVLWLSDLTDSNDEQEVIRTFEILWNGVKERLRKTDLPQELLENAIQVIDQQYQLEIKVDPPFGVCFCEKEDLLSQWKEYGDNTKGISIGFDLNWFIRNGIKRQMPYPSSIQSRSIGCEKVIYHSEKFEEQMAEICYQALKEKGIEAWITLIEPTFKHYSGFVKNPSFDIEHEIRIVYFNIDGLEFKERDVDISELKTDIKKHFEIPWIKNGTQALKSICIGHNCELSKDDIIDALKKNEIDFNIEITESKCSYRIR